MIKKSKVILSLFVALFVLASLYAGAGYVTNHWLDIHLKQWWNVVSTPALLSDITFSNWWDGLSFFTLKSGQRVSVVPSADTIKPLDWFLVNNAGDTVDMTLFYKNDVSPMESIFQKNLDLGWNLLGITTTADPFSNIAWNFSMTVDFTMGSRNRNLVVPHYALSILPEYGEAYWLFVTWSQAIYWWVNNKVAWHWVDDENEGCTAEELLGCLTADDFHACTTRCNRLLTNNISNNVEFLTNQTTRQTVFDGEYTAKKWDLYLNEFAIAETNALQAWDTATFYLSIDGRDVASIDLYEGNTWDSMTFSNVKVKKWDKVSVKLVAEVYAANTGNYTYDLTLKGEDMDGTEAGEATAKTVKMQFVDQGGVTISVATADAADTVLLRDNNIKLAKFTVKPSKTEWTTLDSFVFDLNVANTWAVVVKVDGTEIDEVTESSNTYTVSWLAETLDNDGVVVEISYREELGTGDYTLQLQKVNETTSTKRFNKKVVDALVTITKQENLWDTTRFTFGVEKYDDTINVTALELSGSTNTRLIGNVSDGDTYEVTNGTTAEFITWIEYDDWSAVSIDKATYRDYFKVGSEYAKVFKAKD